MRKYGIPNIFITTLKKNKLQWVYLELASNELYHLAAILQLYWEFDFYEVKKKYYFSKRKGKYFYTFYHFYIETSSKRAK